MLFYGNHAPTAELVIIYGNCQVPFLASLLAAADPERGYLCVLNHAPPGEEAAQPTVEQLRRCCLYLEQFDSQPDLPPWTPVPDISRYGLPLRRFLRTHCPPGCPRLVFPSFVMTCMWPFAAIGDPRNVPEPGHVWGRYPYGNRLVLAVVDQGLTGPAALAAYQRLAAEQMPNFAATLERTKIKLEKRDAHCDVKIADYVWANFRERHLFLSYAHVRAEAIGELALRLHAAIQPVLGSDAASGRQRLRTALAMLPDMDQLEEPIDPTVAAGLGLKFYRPEMRFRWYGQHWTFSEYLSRYLAYDTGW